MYLSSVDVVEDEVEFVGALEGVVEPDEERVRHVLQQHVPLRHDVLHLRANETCVSVQVQFSERSKPASQSWVSSQSGRNLRLSPRSVLRAIKTCVSVLSVMAAKFACQVWFNSQRVPTCVFRFSSVPRAITTYVCLNLGSVLRAAET